MGVEFHFFKMKRVREMHGGEDYIYNNVSILNTPLNCTLFKMAFFMPWLYFTTIFLNMFSKIKKKMLEGLSKATN